MNRRNFLGAALVAPVAVVPVAKALTSEPPSVRYEPPLEDGYTWTPSTGFTHYNTRGVPDWNNRSGRVISMGDATMLTVELE